MVTTPLALAAGMNVAFSINLAQTRAFTTLTSRQPFTVKATIAVTWANGKRDVQEAIANINTQVSIDLAELDETTEVVESGSFALQASVGFIIAMFLFSM